jgi:hypothetical protein
MSAKYFSWKFLPQRYTHKIEQNLDEKKRYIAMISHEEAEVKII